MRRQELLSGFAATTASDDEPLFKLVPSPLATHNNLPSPQSPLFDPSDVPTSYESIEEVLPIVTRRLEDYLSSRLLHLYLQSLRR